MHPRKYCGSNNKEDSRQHVMVDPLSPMWNHHKEAGAANQLHQAIWTGLKGSQKRRLRFYNVANVPLCKET